MSQSELTHLRELVGRIERDLLELKEALGIQPSADAQGASGKAEAKPLYGFFPASDVDWDDFRQARAGWLTGDKR